MNDRLARLLSMPIFGNAMMDRPLFDLAHEIITDLDESYEHRSAAVQVLDKAMGCETPTDRETMEAVFLDYVLFGTR